MTDGSVAAQRTHEATILVLQPGHSCSGGRSMVRSTDGARSPGPGIIQEAPRTPAPRNVDRRTPVALEQAVTEEPQEHCTRQREAGGPRTLDKAKLRAFMAEVNARMGFVPDPSATAEEAQALILADGVRPEENLFSRDIIRAKYGPREQDGP